MTLLTLLLTSECFLAWQILELLFYVASLDHIVVEVFELVFSDFNYLKYLYDLRTVEQHGLAPQKDLQRVLKTDF